MQDEYTVVNEILRESLSFQDELVVSQGLKRAVDYLSIDKKLTIIYLFNRFDEYIPSLTPEFFSNLRLLRNRAKYRFSVVFSVSRPLEDVLESSLLADFYEFLAGHHVYMSLYDPISVNFRISYIEKMTGKSLSKKRIDEVLSLTGGHGKLTRLAVESLFTQEPKESLQEFLLANITIRNGLLEIWKSITPGEQELLEIGKTDREKTQFLEKMGLLTADTMSIKLLDIFMDKSQRIALTKKEPIIFDEATNTIKKGEMVLSDSLTGAEFRLLKYLLLHPDQVMEREDVISVVWQASATTLGVTDQAVDQLVFRLRKKIEEDPNNAEHLHTIKGRGFRFTP